MKKKNIAETPEQFARRFYEKHGFRWDGSERVSEFDGALEVRYVKG